MADTQREAAGIFRSFSGEIKWRASGRGVRDCAQKLNARLFTCIFKNDQKNKNKKKRKKLNSVQEFKMVVFSE